MIRLSGRLRSALIIGGQGIRARKLRTLLSMLSLFLGVLAVVVVQAGAQTARQAALSDVELTSGKDGTVTMFVPPDPKIMPAALETVTGRAGVVASLVTQATIGEPNVSPVNPGAAPFDRDGPGYFAPPPDVAVRCDQNGVCAKIILGPGDQQTNGEAIELQLVAVTGDIREFRPFRPVSGQWLDHSGDASLSPRLVLNQEAAKGFGRHVVPAQMHVTGATADATPRIIGVIDDGIQQPTAYVRADELLNWLPADQLTASGFGLILMMTPQAADDVGRILRARATAAGVPLDELHTETIHSKREIESRLALLNWIFLGMAGLVLLIGVAGILNVSLATVGERVEEFALRRAVGTPRSLLAGIVLAETMLTGLLTAAAAIGASALALKVAGRLLASHTSYLTNLAFPWQAGVAGVIAGLVAGLLGGLIPALRAARIPIATVMRA